MTSQDSPICEATLNTRLKGTMTGSQRLFNQSTPNTVQELFFTLIKIIMLAFFTSSFVVIFNSTYKTDSVTPRSECTCPDGKVINPIVGTGAGISPSSDVVTPSSGSPVNFVNANGVKYCKVRDWNTPIMNNNTCIVMDTLPRTHVCLHDPSKDSEVSGRVLKEQIWERTLIGVLQNALSTDPAMGFIDIGSNIGIFSNLVAKMDHPVVAVEPSKENNLLCHLAVKTNLVENKVTLVENAVSDSRGKYNLVYFPGHLARSELTIPGSASAQTVTGHGVPTQVDTVLTSDLLEVITFKTAAMKIDVEGHESRVILGAAGLLDTVDIPFIFMQWDRLKILCSNQGGTTEDRELLGKMLALLDERNYKPFSLHYQPISVQECLSWPGVVLWRKK